MATRPPFSFGLTPDEQATIWEAPQGLLGLSSPVPDVAPVPDPTVDPTADVATDVPPTPDPLAPLPDDNTQVAATPEPSQPLVIEDTDQKKSDLAKPSIDKPKPKVIADGPTPPKVIDENPTAMDRSLMTEAAKRLAQLDAADKAGQPISTTDTEAAYADAFAQTINGSMRDASAKEMKEYADRLADEVFGGEITSRPSLGDLQAAVARRKQDPDIDIAVSPVKKKGNTDSLALAQLKAGVTSTAGIVWSGLQAIGEVTGVGDKGKATGLKGEYYNALSNELPQGTSVKDIHSFGDALQWAQGAALTNLPNLAVAVTGGAAGSLLNTTIGGALGAFGPSFLMESGTIEQQNKQIDPNSKAGLATIIGGGAAAALDSVLPGHIGSQLVGRVGREAAEEIALRTLLLPASDKMLAALKSGGVAFAKGTAIEGSTEAAQQAIEEISTAVQTKTPIQPGLLQRMVDAGAAGALLGGPAEVGGHAVEQSANAQAPIDEFANADFARPAAQVATDRLSPPQTKQPTPVPVDAQGRPQTFIIPNGPVTSRFGPRHAFRTANGNMSSSNHAGIDIGLPSGTPVPAGASGVVAFAGVRGGYGNQVVIKFSDGTSASYSHLSKINAEVGDHVSQGEIVGRVGATGNATGPHLHLERRDAQGRPVNPLTGRVVRTSKNEDGTNEDDTPWDTSDEPYTNEMDAPFPKEEIDQEWEKTTGQKIAPPDEPAAPPPQAEPEPPSEVVQAAAEVLGHSPVPAPESVVADLEESLGRAKDNNPAAQALAQIHVDNQINVEGDTPDYGQPLQGEEPLFDEDQQTVVGFVNPETGDTRAVGEAPVQSGTNDFVATSLQGSVATTPETTEGSITVPEEQPLGIGPIEDRIAEREQVQPIEPAPTPMDALRAKLEANRGQQAEVATEPEITPEIASSDAANPVATETPEVSEQPELEAAISKIDDKLFDLENEGTKSQVKAYAQRLVKQGVLDQRDVDALAPMMRDRDMGPEDIISEIRTSVSLWEDSQRSPGQVKARVIEDTGATTTPVLEEPLPSDPFARRVEEARRAAEQGRPQAVEQRREEGPRLERPPVQEGRVLLDHFSVEEELSSTDPAFYGRHEKVFSKQELAYLKSAPPRTYFGIATGQNGGYKNEFTGRSHFQASVPAERLYDVAADPENLWVQGDPAQSEWNIKNANHAGYWHANPQLGMVAIVFEPMQVEKVAAKPKAQLTSREEGRQREDQRAKARAYKANIQQRVLKIYEEMGGQGLIPVEVVDSLKFSEGEAAGTYSPQDRIIRIAAFAAHDIRGTARHEVVHWAVDNGVWNADEWRLLKKWASAQPNLMAWARENYPKAAYSEEDILEEAVAEGFARWDNGRLQQALTPPDTAVAKLLQKLKDIIDALRAAFTQAGVSRGELREAIQILADFENGKRLAKLRKVQDTRPTFGRRPWNDDLSREMLSGNLAPEDHWFLSQQKGDRFQSGWHGSPQTDIEKFNLAFIGQGEGAQAFGWGLYFAEKKAVAEWYQRKLTMGTKDPVDVIVQVNGQSIRDWAGERFEGPYGIAIYEVADRIFSFLTTNKPYNGWLEAIHARTDNDIDGWVAKSRQEGNVDEVEDLLAEQRKINDLFTALDGQTVDQKAYPKGGNLYKVEVPENEELIDLDKKLNEQPPKILEALEKVRKDMVATNGELYGQRVEEMDLRDFYDFSALTFFRVVMPNYLYNFTNQGMDGASDAMENALVNGHTAMAASIWLRDKGVKGARYLDRDSRTPVEPGAKPTANFVIFDDNAIELKAKYRVIQSSIANSPLSDPTIPDPSLFRRIHDQTMGFLGAIAGKDVDASDNLIDAFRRKVINRYQQIIKTQKRSAEQLGVDALPAGQNPMEMITADERGYKLGYLTDNMIRPMATEMAQRGVAMDDLGLYLYARHAPARNARIAKINKEFSKPDNPGSGMKDSEAQQIMIDFATDGKLGDLQEVAKHIDAMIQYAQQERLDGGLLSSADVAAGFGPGDFYVPLRGNEEVEPELEMDFGLAATKGGGFSISGQESHRMFGRASRADLESIVGYSISQAQTAIDRAYRNKVGQSMLGMFRATPDNQFVQIDRVKRVAVWNKAKGQVEYQMQTRITDPKEAQRTIYVKENGEVTKMTFNDKNPSAMRFVKAAKNLGAAKLHRVLQLMSAYTRLFTKSNTQWNLDFMLANAAKDIQTGVVNASTLGVKGLRRAMIRNIVSMRPLMASWWGVTHPAGAGLGSGHKWRELYAEFAENGGKLNYGQVEPVQDALRSARREIKNASRSWANPIKLVEEVGGWIDRGNSAFENMTRLSAYAALRDAGIDAKRAAVAVRELTTNFQQHGEWGPKFNAAYGFANASVIGGARFGYTVVRKPQLLAGLIGVGMLVDFLNDLWDPDEWDQYTEEDKDREFIVLLPQSAGFDIKIPIGYGVNSFVTTGRKFSELWRGKKKQDGTKLSVLDAASDMAWSFYNAFAPVSGHTFFNVLAPTALDPIVDIYQNQNNWGRPIMPPAPDRKEQQVPDSQLAFERTGQFWKTLAETMNRVGGGNDVVPGWTPLDISPESYKHVTEETVGGAGRTFLRALSLGDKLTTGQDVGPNDIPVVRRFAGTPYGGASAKDEQTSAFYDRLNTARVVIAQAKEMQARYGHDSQTYQEFRKENEPIINFAEHIKKAESKLRAYNTADNAADRGTHRADGLNRRDRRAIFMATKIMVPAGRPLTDEEVAKIKAKLRDKKTTLSQRFNELWLSDVMKE